VVVAAPSCRRQECLLQASQHGTSGRGVHKELGSTAAERYAESRTRRKFSQPWARGYRLVNKHSTTQHCQDNDAYNDLWSRLILLWAPSRLGSLLGLGAGLARATRHTSQPGTLGSSSLAVGRGMVGSIAALTASNAATVLSSVAVCWR